MIYFNIFQLYFSFVIHVYLIYVSKIYFATEKTICRIYSSCIYQIYRIYLPYILNIYSVYDVLYFSKHEFAKGMNLGYNFLKIENIIRIFSKCYFLYKSEIYSPKYIWHILDIYFNNAEIYFPGQNLYMSHIHILYFISEVVYIIATRSPI